MKKEIREKFIRRLRRLCIDTEFVKKYANIGDPLKYVTIVNILDKGNNVAQCHCQECGHSYTVPHSFYSYGSKQYFRCPSCGNSLFADRPGYMPSAHKKMRLIVKTENGFEFVCFTLKDCFKDVDKWYNENPVVSVIISEAGIFDNEHGFMVAKNEQYDIKVLKKNSMEESSQIYWLKDFTDTNMTHDECLGELKKANNFYNAQRQEAEAKSRIRRERKAEAEQLKQDEEDRKAREEEERYQQKLLADERCQYKTDNQLNVEVIKNPIFARYYSCDADGNYTHQVICSKCGSVKEVQNLDIDSGYTCECGNHMSDVHELGIRSQDTVEQSLFMFENTNLDENDLLMRFFRHATKIDQNNVITTSLVETQRIFAGNQLRYYYHTNNNTFDDRNTNAYSYYHYALATKTQQDDEIVDIIKGSALRYSGLIDAWGLGEYKYNYCLKMPNLSYLQSWYVNHGIECVMKANLTNITEHFISSPEDMAEGKTLAEVLGVDKSLVKYIIANDIGFIKLTSMRNMYAEDNTMTPEIYEDMERCDASMRYFMQIANTHHIRYADMLQYLQSAYDHQCIDKRETMSVWFDYLNMARQIGIDLNDKTKRFPSSLKKEHDIATFAYRAVKLSIDKEKFDLQAQKNSFYEFEYKNLIAVVPKDPQEIIEEAQAQRNCLRSYIERVRDGNTIVAFVRRKDQPEKTYLSAEIYDGKLTQLKGYCNSNPRSREIIEFTKEWAKAKNFSAYCL